MRPALGFSDADDHSNLSFAVQFINDHQEQGMVGSERCIRDSSKCKYDFVTRSSKLTAKAVLIMAAAVIYAATSHGIDVRVVDSTRIGEDLKKAIKVCQIPKASPSRITIPIMRNPSGLHNLLTT